MRKYNQENELETVVCNKCKKELRVENGILKEGCFHVDYVFGYFSRKDGQKHSFDLCENCYDGMLETLTLPADIRDERELL